MVTHWWCVGDLLSVQYQKGENATLVTTRWQWLLREYTLQVGHTGGIDTCIERNSDANSIIEHTVSENYYIGISNYFNIIFREFQIRDIIIWVLSVKYKSTIIVILGYLYLAIYPTVYLLSLTSIFPAWNGRGIRPTLDVVRSNWKIGMPYRR